MSANPFEALDTILKEMVKSKTKLDRAGIEIERSDKQKIILPDKMTLSRAIDHLQLLREEEETTTEISYVFDCFPYEGALGLMEVLADKYGNALTTSTQISSFFGTTSAPPKIMQLEVGPGVFKQIVWGAFIIPPIKDGVFQTGFDERNGSVVFKLTGTIKQKDKGIVNEIAIELRKWLKESSPFRGQALTIQVDAEGMMTPNYPPKIIDTTGFDESDLILPPEVYTQIEALLFNPVKNTKFFKEEGIPINRGSLLVGQYGTGKTLTARILSGICVRNGWTYVYVEDPELLIKSIQFARKYSPTVVFCEDVDLFLSERNPRANEIINEIDGLTSKSEDVLVVLTTNNPHNIHKSLLRPGRMDLVLHFPLPDVDVTARLIRKFAGASLNTIEDIGPAIDKLVGHIPASIAEAVQRAKMMALSMNGNSNITNKELTAAAVSLQAHHDLLQEPQQTTHELALSQIADSHRAIFDADPVSYLEKCRKRRINQSTTAADAT